ncbi:hypothetical protein H0O01_02225 [Candidatus Micrarchaeota archaeon]|nr:hypothetical protein [Candidatus Micrarchaeota archaeon]
MAGAEGLDYIIKKAEESAVQKFKNQNKVLKRFKKPGLKVYKAITRKGLSGAELSEKSGVSPEELAEIVSFMEKAGMVELEAGEVKGEKAPKREERKEEKKEEEKPAPRAPPREELPPAAPPRLPPRAPIGINISPEITGRNQRVSAIQPPASGKPPSAPALPSRAPPAAPPKFQPRIPPRGVSEEIRPISEEEMGREERIPEERIRPPKAEEKEIEEKPAAREEEEGIKPLEFEEEKKPVAPRVPPRAPPRTPPEEISPPPRAPRAPPPQAPPEAPEAEEEYLTPSEKAIKDRYGEVGLKVYGFIDGQRTAEQIMRETGVTEAQLIEMLDFMEKKGIIRLEHPERRRAPPPPPRAAAPMAPPGAAPPGMAPPIGPQLRPPAGAVQAPKTMFSPMVEEKPELGAQISDKELASVSLDIPTKTTKDIIAEIRAKAQVMLKFGKDYVKAFELMDGKRDVVDLTLQLKLPLYKIYDVLKFLQELKVIMLKPSAREDIRRKYGEDGYSVYKKYGREGVLLYQLIGKEMSLKEMAALTTLEPSKVIDMFLFIHKLLGIELPIDEEVLRERLGIKKEEKKPPPA